MSYSDFYNWIYFGSSFVAVPVPLCGSTFNSLVFNEQGRGRSAANTRFLEEKQLTPPMSVYKVSISRGGAVDKMQT